MGALALLVIGSLISLFWYVPQTSIADLWNDVDTYVKQTQTYSLNYEERFASISVEGTQTLAAKAPGTVIVVIGESASRN